jgi:hypothetical protein
MDAEDVGDLQGRPPHGGTTWSSQLLQRTDHLAQDVGGDLGIKGGRFQLLVAEQDLDQADVDLLLQQVSSEGMTPMPSSA